MTLVESIIYLALFALIFTTMVQYMLNISRSNQLAEDSIVIERSAIFINQHIYDTFKQSELILLEESTFNNNSGELTLITSSTPTVEQVTYSLNPNGKIIYTNQAGEQFALTENQLRVTALYFEQVLDSTDNLVGVRLTYTVKTEQFNNEREYQTSYLLDIN